MENSVLVARGVLSLRRESVLILHPAARLLASQVGPPVRTPHVMSSPASYAFLVHIWLIIKRWE